MSEGPKPTGYFCEPICEKLWMMGPAASEHERRFMKSWDLRSGDLRPHSPEILSSSGDARTDVWEIPAGESHEDHQVYRAAWATVIGGEAEITTAVERAWLAEAV